MPIQVSYSSTMAPVRAGMPLDSFPVDEVSYPAGEAIPYGVMVELVNGVARRPQGTTTTMNVVGASMYDPTRESSVIGSSGLGYVVGDAVRVMRRGRIVLQFSGTTPGLDLNATSLNISHSSTTATNRGTITDAATATTAGAEIQAAPSGMVWVRNPGVAGLCTVELNLC